MFENNEDNDNLNNFLNDDNYNSSDTEKIISAVSKVEVGIISAIAGFFENISFIEETQLIEDNITLNASNVITEIQSLREILLKLPLLKNINSNDETNNSQNEIIEKLNSIIEGLKTVLNKPQTSGESKINLNINEALKPLNQQLESISSYINEITSQIESLKTSNKQNGLSEENIKEICNTIEANDNNDSIFNSLNNLNQNLEEIKHFVDNNEHEICNKLENDIQNLIKAIEINEDIYNNQTQCDIFEALNNLNSKISIITHTNEEANEGDVKNLFANVEEIINRLNALDINIQTVEQNQNSVDVKYELDSLKDELAQIVDEKTSRLDENQNYNVNEILQTINSIKDNISSLDDKVNNINRNQEDNSFNEEIKTNLTKLSQLVESSSSSYSNEIQNEIKETKDTIIESVAGFFANLNFEEEQEAIQNYIVENKNDISDKINQTFVKIDEKLTPITSTIQNIDVLKENVCRINDIFSKSANEIDDNSGAYNYTFIDLENDIIKLNMMLNGLTTSLNQNLDENKSAIKDELSNVSNIVESFKNENTSFIKDELSNVTEIVESFKNENTSFIKGEISNLSSVVESTNEDISSISKRTNKLIILADEAQNAYNTNVEKFKNLTSQIITQINNLTSLGQDFSNIINKQNLTLNNINNLNEAFGYLASWIDETDVVFKNIQENVNKTVKNEDLNLVRISIEDRLNSIENVVSNIDNSINDMTLKLNSYEEINVNVEDKIGSFDEVFENIENNINDNNFKINNLSEQIADVENSFNNNLISKLDRVNEVIEELQNSYEETNNSINEKIENIENKLNNKSDYNDKLDEIIQKLKENEKTNNEISKKLEEKEQIFEQMKSDIDNVHKLNAKVNGIEDVILRLDKKITRIVNYIDED